jgi:hypothetical protein
MASGEAPHKDDKENKEDKDDKERDKKRDKKSDKKGGGKKSDKKGGEAAEGGKKRGEAAEDAEGGKKRGEAAEDAEGDKKSDEAAKDVKGGKKSDEAAEDTESDKENAPANKTEDEALSPTGLAMLMQSPVTEEEAEEVEGMIGLAEIQEGVAAGDEEGDWIWVPRELIDPLATKRMRWTRPSRAQIEATTKMLCSPTRSPQERVMKILDIFFNNPGLYTRLADALAQQRDEYKVHMMLSICGGL